MIGDGSPHSESIILGEVASCGVGASLELVVACVRAWRRVMGGIGTIERGEMWFEWRGLVEVVA